MPLALNSSVRAGRLAPFDFDVPGVIPTQLGVHPVTLDPKPPPGTSPPACPLWTRQSLILAGYAPPDLPPGGGAVRSKGRTAVGFEPAGSDRPNRVLRQPRCAVVADAVRSYTLAEAQAVYAAFLPLYRSQIEPLGASVYLLGTDDVYRWEAGSPLLMPGVVATAAVEGDEAQPSLYARQRLTLAPATAFPGGEVCWYADMLAGLVDGRFGGGSGPPVIGSYIATDNRDPPFTPMPSGLATVEPGRYVDTSKLAYDSALAGPLFAGFARFRLSFFASGGANFLAAAAALAPLGVRTVPFANSLPGTAAELAADIAAFFA